MIEGISHITFIVRDLSRMEELLSKVLGARKVYDSCNDSSSISNTMFFLVGDAWIAIIEGDALNERTYDHVAFKIDEAVYEDRLQMIKALGLELNEGRSRIPGEGRSIYFHDYDNHLFELHTGTLEERLKSYKAAKRKIK